MYQIVVGEEAGNVSGAWQGYGGVVRGVLSVAGVTEEMLNGLLMELEY